MFTYQLMHKRSVRPRAYKDDALKDVLVGVMYDGNAVLGLTGSQRSLRLDRARW